MTMKKGFCISTFKENANGLGNHATSTAKAKLHLNKVMLYVWWDIEEIVYFEFFPRNQATPKFILDN